MEILGGMVDVLRVHEYPYPLIGVHTLQFECEFFREFLVLLRVGLLQELEESAPLPDHHKKASPGMVVFRMFLQMVRKLFYLLCEKPNLDLCGTGIGVMSLVFPDNPSLFGFRKHRVDFTAYFALCQKSRKAVVH